MRCTSTTGMGIIVDNERRAEQAEVRTDTRQTQSRLTQSRQGWVE